MGRLERRLRDDRPTPSQQLVDQIVSRIETAASSSPAPVTLGRLKFAVVAVVVMLTALAAFGGVGFAASGVSGAASSTVHAVATLVNPDQTGGVSSGGANPTTASQPQISNNTASQPQISNNNGNGDDDDECPNNNNGNGNNDNGADDEEYCPPRVTICHVTVNRRGMIKEKTLTLPPRAARRHLDRHPLDYEGPCDGRSFNG